MMRRVAFTGLVVAALGLAGCLSNGLGRKFEPLPYDKVTYAIPNPKVMPGKIGHHERLLTGVFSSEPKTFNYFLQSEVSSGYVLNYLYESLVEPNPRTALTEPSMAQSWTISPDQKTYVFALRKGLRWSDGRPITADDVVFTFNEIVANPKFPDNSSVDGVKIDGKFPTVTKVDDLHVKFVLPRVFGPFLSTVAGGVAIMPMHQWAPLVREHDKDGRLKVYTAFGIDSQPSQLVTSGAYTIASYTPNQRVIFNRNPYYALRVDGAHHPLPYADQLMLLIMPDATTEILKMMSKEADFMLEEVKPRYYQTLKPLEKTGGFTVADGGTDFGSFFITLNLNRDKGPKGNYYVPLKKQHWFQNLHFRHALSDCLDRKTVVDNLAMNLGEPAFSPLSPSSPYFDPNVPRYDYNLAHARQELKAGGFHWDAQGRCLDDRGNRVEFDLLVYTESANSVPFGNIFKADLERVGIKLNVRPVLFNVIVDKSQNTLDFDSYIMGFTGSVEPNLGANMWRSDGRMHSFNQRLKGKSTTMAPNYPWEDRIDQIFSQASATLDEKKRHQLFDEWQEIVAEQLPVIHIYDVTSFYVYRSAMQNAHPTALAATFMYHPFVTPGQYFMQ